MLVLAYLRKLVTTDTEVTVVKIQQTNNKKCLTLRYVCSIITA